MRSRGWLRTIIWWGSRCSRNMGCEKGDFRVGVVPQGRRVVVVVIITIVPVNISHGSSLCLVALDGGDVNGRRDANLPLMCCPILKRQSATTTTTTTCGSALRARLAMGVKIAIFLFFDIHAQSKNIVQDPVSSDPPIAFSLSRSCTYMHGSLNLY